MAVLSEHDTYGQPESVHSSMDPTMTSMDSESEEGTDEERRLRRLARRAAEAASSNGRGAEGTSQRVESWVSQKDGSS